MKLAAYQFSADCPARRGGFRPARKVAPATSRRYTRNMFRALLAILLLVSPTLIAAQASKVQVALRTEVGDIELELDPAHAPATTANFLRYVQGGFYDGGTFHRAVTMQNQPQNNVKIEVVQAGINPAREKDSFPPIALERTSSTGLHHVDGAISMARAGPDSATSDFFICIGSQPELDFGGRRNPDGQGFAAFGRVLRGMDVVRRIQTAPADGQKLAPPIRIVSASLVKVQAERK